MRTFVNALWLGLVAAIVIFSTSCASQYVSGKFSVHDEGMVLTRLFSKSIPFDEFKLVEKEGFIPGPVSLSNVEGVRIFFRSGKDTYRLDFMDGCQFIDAALGPGETPGIWIGPDKLYKVKGYEDPNWPRKKGDKLSQVCRRQWTRYRDIKPNPRST